MNPFSFLHSAVRRVARVPRLWLVYYITTLLFALAAALPLAALLFTNLGHTLWAEGMLANFDMGWFAEFAYKTGGWPGASYGPGAMVLAGGFFLLATFLAGGAITIFAAAHGGYDAGAFWAACGRNFGRLLRLGIVAGVCYAVVMAAYGWSGSLQQSLFRNSMLERPVALFGWGRTAVAALVLLFVNMIADYARVRLVVDDSRRALRAFFGSFGFVLRNFGAAAGLYALAMLVLAVLAAAGHFATRATPQTAAGWLILLALLQQAFILGRIWAKLLFYAGETGVYQALRRIPDPEPVAVAAPAPEPEIADGTEPRADTEPAVEPAEQ